MMWKPSRRQAGQRPMVNAIHETAPRRMPYFPQGSENPQRVQRTCQPGARRSGSMGGRGTRLEGGHPQRAKRMQIGAGTWMMPLVR